MKEAGSWVEKASSFQGFSKFVRATGYLTLGCVNFTYIIKLFSYMEYVS